MNHSNSLELSDNAIKMTNYNYCKQQNNTTAKNLLLLTYYVRQR